MKCGSIVDAGCRRTCTHLLVQSRAVARNFALSVFINYANVKLRTKCGLQETYRGNIRLKRVIRTRIVQLLLND